ncbi:MAG: isochorismatase family cysteine hydrolase [Trebonia sp.]|jgi:nicotinamidase-related amidase
MTVSALDARTALIVIDLQRGTIGSRPMAHPAEDVIARATELAAAFRQHRLPVVLVNHAGQPPGRTQYSPGGGGDWPPELTELVPGLGTEASDLRITKHSLSPFVSTDLDAQLRKLGVTQVVLAGVATSYGVESAARQAYDLGYNVVVAADAVTDPTAEGHANSLGRVIPVVGQTGTASEIISLLAARA